MKVVILAGGLGTRISEETQLRPKPMVEIGGKPILWHILKIYSAHGLNDFVICLGYKGYLIKEYFANYFLHTSDVTFDLSANQMQVHYRHTEPWRVTLVDTGDGTQTGGRLKRVREYVGGEDFCFTYGDGLADLDLRAEIAFHRAQGTLATVAAVQPPGRFGALTLDSQRIRGFNEKPQGDSSWINGGFFVLSPKAIDYIEGDQVAWERAPLERLAAEGQLSAFVHRGFWQPMDHLRDKTLLEELLGVWQGSLEDLGMTPSFWRDRRVLVTGHTGFKGGWCTLWLHHLGAKVLGYALEPPSSPSLYELAGVGSTMESVIADVRDRTKLNAVAIRFQPEVVLHFAAQSLVRVSYAEPFETFSVNVLGTAAILDAVLATPTVRAVVVATSDKCYENREHASGYRESDALGGSDPYSSSKACAAGVTAAYRESFFRDRGIGLATVRAGNVIGGGDWAKDRLVPDLIRALEEGRSALVRNPWSTRPWQHVLDPLAGYLTVAERLAENTAAEAWNFGPAQEAVVPVAELAEDICRLWGGGARWHHEAIEQPHEARRLALDATKAQKALGWMPRLSYREALAWTVEWYQANGRRPARELTLGQIARYEELSR